MKPISTVPRALATIDAATGEPAVAINQRSDACAVPRGSVVMEAMVALVLADAVLEKFGGDSVTETRRNAQAYLDALPLPMSGPLARPRRPARRRARPPSGTARGRGRSASPFRDTDRGHRGRRRHQRRRPLRRVRRGRTSAASRSRPSPVALAEHDGVLALGGGAVTSDATRALLVAYGRAGGVVVWLDVDLPSAAKRVGLSRDRPILGVNPRAMLRTMLEHRAPLYAEVATHEVADRRAASPTTSSPRCPARRVPAGDAR